MSQIRKLIESLDSIIDGKESNADLPQVKKPKTKNKFLGKPFKPKEGGIVEALTAQYEDFVKNKAVPDSKEKLTMSQREDGAWQVKNEKGDVVSKGTKADCNDYISKKNSALNDAKLDEGSTSKEKQKRPYKTMAQHKEAGKAFGAKVDADKKAAEAEKIGRKKTNESADGKWIVYRSADDFKTFPTYRAATAFHNKFGERGYKVASAAWFHDKMKPQGKVDEGFETPRGYNPSRVYQHFVKEYNNAKLMAKSCASTGDERSAEMYHMRAQECYDKLAELDKQSGAVTEGGEWPNNERGRAQQYFQEYADADMDYQDIVNMMLEAGFSEETAKDMALDGGRIQTESVGGSEPDTDAILEYLTSAYRMLASSGLFSRDGEGELKVIYEMLRTPLMEGDFSKFDEMFSYISGRYPDMFDELVDQMYSEAGLGDHGTYEQFMAKVGGGGLEEGKSENRLLRDKINSKGIVPSIDRERYTDMSGEGLEGPFRGRNGQVLYYDPKAGKYYNRDSDMYVDHGLDESTGYAMDDIAVGGTVIYKSLDGHYKVSKVRGKGPGMSLQLMDGSRIQNAAVVSTDYSDWAKYKNAGKVSEAMEVVPTKTNKLAKMRSMLDKLSATLAKTKQSLGGKQGVVDEEMPVVPSGVKTAMPAQPAQPAQPATNAQPAMPAGAAPANAPAAPAPGTPVPPQGSATNAATTPGEQVKALVQTLATNPAAAKQLGTKLNTIR